MKNLILFIAFLVVTTHFSTAQNNTCNCKADLDFVVEELKKTPSYKKQIKGDKKQQFEDAYKNSVSKISSETTISECYKILNQQINIVNDLHIGLSSIRKNLTKDEAVDSLKLQTFLKGNMFKSHPKTAMNIDSLKTVLAKAENTSAEGLYNLGTDSITIGVVKVNANTLHGIVLESDNPLWQKGQIYLYAQKNNYGKYDMFQYHKINRNLIYLKNLILENGRLHGLKKTNNKLNFEFKRDKKSNWEFKQLSDNTQYVYFGSFSNSSENVKAFKAFYKTYEKRFNAKNIIVDLRSNGGGNSKWSDPFIKLFKNSNAKIYVITNQFSMSNSEQFTIKLKKKLNAIHLGQTTYGAIAYGTNYGRTYETPSGEFSLRPTDMNFHKNFYEYEGFGIVPDIKLSFDKDWIEQAIEIINNNDSNG